MKSKKGKYKNERPGRVKEVRRENKKKIPN